MSSGFSLPVKQSAPPVPSSKQVFTHTQPSNMLPDYENLVLANELSSTMPMKYDGECSQPMSLKYAELCTVPKSAQYPEMYMGPGQYDTFFPVDTPNTIPNVPAADFKQQTQDKSRDASNNQFADTDDLDLFSLLALPDPTNKAPQMYECDPFMYSGVQPELDFLGSAMPDDIHYWNGFQKESNNGATQTPANVVESFGFPNGSEDIVFPTDPTLESFLLLEGGSQAMSPVNSEPSPMSDDGSVQSNSPRSEKWDKGLRDLFERTFDLSDIEGDYMFPPPNKRQEAPSNSHYWAKPGLTPPSPSPSQYWASEQKPQLSIPSQHWGSERKPQLPPSSPPPPIVKPASPSSQVEAMSPTPHPPPEPINGKHTKSKAKPTLLFGKHEGEIIQKLLVANDNARSKPITRDKLITIPVEEFNQLLEEAQLSEIEVAFMKEWRRRGKNKAAAQIARKRKREEVSGLDEEVEKLRQQKVELQKNYDHLRSLVQSLKERSVAAEDRLFQKQSESSVEPVSRNTHLIHVTDDEKLLLIPKISSKILVVNS